MTRCQLAFHALLGAALWGLIVLGVRAVVRLFLVRVVQPIRSL